MKPGWWVLGNSKRSRGLWRKLERSSCSLETTDNSRQSRLELPSSRSVRCTGQLSSVRSSANETSGQSRLYTSSRRGRPQRPFSASKTEGSFFIGQSTEDSIRQVVADFRELSGQAPLRETLVVTGTRLQAVELNRAIQAERFREGWLGDERVRIKSDHFHIGDRVLFRRNSALVMNGDRGEVTKLDTANHLLTVKLDSGRRVTIDLESYDDVQLGYASTTHSVQGKTLRNCLVLVGGSMQDRESTYVQASRAKLETRLYADELTAGEELGDLVREMTRSRQKDMAVTIAANSDFDLELD